jgi:hypothetical protein
LHVGANGTPCTVTRKLTESGGVLLYLAKASQILLSIDVGIC